jgi:hypothetical protein
LHFSAFAYELDEANSGLDSQSVSAADTESLRDTKPRKEAKGNNSGVSFPKLFGGFDYRRSRI